MKKSSNGPSRLGKSASATKRSMGWVPFASGVLFAFFTCLCSPSTIKGTALFLILPLAVALICMLIYRDRLSIPLLGLALICTLGGISTFYAVSRKFALYEFLKLLCAFSLTLILLAFCRGKDPGRSMAQVLATSSALVGLVSIDLISTRLLSGAFTGLLHLLSSTDYVDQKGLEAGVRMVSLFDNPNIFAGVAGLGVLLSLSLAVSEAPGWRRTVHICLLYVNSLAFVLAFSMGASGAIAAAFLVYLVLEVPQRRSGLLVLMAETLLLSVLAAALISQTSFQAWEGPRPIPLLCAVLGAAALWALDRFVGMRIACKLKGKGLIVVIAAILAALVAFGLVAYHWTSGVTLDAKGSLRRAVYPAPGAYTVETSGREGGVSVTVESQNQQETMMHTSTVLYKGALDEAAFTVPEDSLVVYFNLYTKEGAHLDSLACQGEGRYDVPLDYPLLPSFIANRLQGLWANENAIQRFVFFSDGMKLFRRSPVVGLGMGAFENGIRSVQSFDYETKYAHNHYIQTLVETGVLGLLLFVGLLGVSAAAVILARRRKDQEGAPVCHPLIPALGAALVFMAIHAATEVVFSTYPYLPMAFGVFGLIGLCCGGALGVKCLGDKGEIGCVIGMGVLVLAFTCCLSANMLAKSAIDANPTMTTLISAADSDPFEWADYALSYVNSAMSMDTIDKATQAKADEMAQRLAKVDSNTIPIYLSQYYFRTQRTQLGFQMMEKYLAYVSSHAEAWESAFGILQQYNDGSEEFRQGVVHVGQMLAEWNRENMGTIALSDQAQTFLAQMGG